MVIVEWEGTVLGVNLGRPIVTNKDFVAWLLEVCEPIELSFWVVIGIVEFGEAIKNPAYRIFQTEYSGCLDISAHA